MTRLRNLFLLRALLAVLLTAGSAAAAVDRGDTFAASVPAEENHAASFACAAEVLSTPASPGVGTVTETTLGFAAFINTLGLLDADQRAEPTSLSGTVGVPDSALRTGYVAGTKSLGPAAPPAERVSLRHRLCVYRL